MPTAEQIYEIFLDSDENGKPKNRAGKALYTLWDVYRNKSAEEMDLNELQFSVSLNELMQGAEENVLKSSKGNFVKAMSDKVKQFNTALNKLSSLDRAMDATADAIDAMEEFARVDKRTVEQRMSDLARTIILENDTVKAFRANTHPAQKEFEEKTRAIDNSKRRLQKDKEQAKNLENLKLDELQRQNAKRFEEDLAVLWVMENYRKKGDYAAALDNQRMWEESKEFRTDHNFRLAILSLDSRAPDSDGMQKVLRERRQESLADLIGRTAKDLAAEPPQEEVKAEFDQLYREAAENAILAYRNVRRIIEGRHSAFQEKPGMSEEDKAELAEDKAAALEGNVDNLRACIATVVAMDNFRRRGDYRSGIDPDAVERAADILMNQEKDMDEVMQALTLPAGSHTMESFFYKIDRPGLAEKCGVFQKELDKELREEVRSEKQRVREEEERRRQEEETRRQEEESRRQRELEERIQKEKLGADQRISDVLRAIILENDNVKSLLLGDHPAQKELQGKSASELTRVEELKLDELQRQNERYLKEDFALLWAMGDAYKQGDYVSVQDRSKMRAEAEKLQNSMDFSLAWDALKLGAQNALGIDKILREHQRPELADRISPVVQDLEAHPQEEARAEFDELYRQAAENAILAYKNVRRLIEGRHRANKEVAKEDSPMDAQDLQDALDMNVENLKACIATVVAMDNYRRIGDYRSGIDPQKLEESADALMAPESGMEKAMEALTLPVGATNMETFFYGIDRPGLAEKCGIFQKEMDRKLRTEVKNEREQRRQEKENRKIEEENRKREEEERKLKEKEAAKESSKKFHSLADQLGGVDKEPESRRSVVQRPFAARQDTSPSPTGRFKAKLEEMDRAVKESKDSVLYALDIEECQNSLLEVFALREMGRKDPFTPVTDEQVEEMKGQIMDNKIRDSLLYHAVMQKMRIPGRFEAVVNAIKANPDSPDIKDFKMKVAEAAQVKVKLKSPQKSAEKTAENPAGPSLK